MIPNDLGIFETSDGSHSIFSEQFQVSYHSKHGAIQETKHVFIEAGLRYKAVLKNKLSILDIGFGTGLNAYITALEASRMGLDIDYVGVEAYPISSSQIATLNYTEQTADTSEQLQKLHECAWSSPTRINPYFQIEKIQAKFEDLDFENRFDVIYFDAFAPNAQPHLWEAPLMTAMYAALKPEGVLVTYCAKGVVKRTMKSVGFEIEALKGPPGKREMTRAAKPRITDNG